MEHGYVIFGIGLYQLFKDALSRMSAVAHTVILWAIIRTKMSCMDIRIVQTNLGLEMNNLKNWIKKYEGFSSVPYFDTGRKLHIGYGRNLDDHGVSEEEADYLLENDIAHCLDNLNRMEWFISQPDGVKDALINMCFNIGFTRLLTFQKMIDALVAKDYTKAASEALDSRWAEEVGQRAKDIAVMIRECAD